MPFLSLAFLLALTTFITPPCFAATAEKVPTLRMEVDVPSIDWQVTLDLASLRIILNIMHGLTRYEADGRLVPTVAKSWKITNQGKTYQFDLRKDVVWSDGVPLTAHHFVDAFRRILDPKTGAVSASRLG